MTCDWESEPGGWCQYPGKVQWLKSRLARKKGLERVLTESTHIKCVDMLARCKYE
jgi:hypothetical protein